MAEFKAPKNPHNFKKGTILSIGGALAMLGGFWAFLRGNETMDRSIAYDEGASDGVMAMARYSHDLIEETKSEVINDNKEEEESP